MIKKFNNTFNIAYNLIGKIIPIFFIVLILSGFGIFFIFCYISSGSFLSSKVIIILLIISFLLIVGFLIINSILFIRFKKLRKNFNYELDFYKLILENTGDIILLLDGFGTIISYNSALNNILSVSEDYYIGKPFREIFRFGSLAENKKYKSILMNKLKDVFSGLETEVILPLSDGENKNLETLHLKLKPKFENNNLINIFAIGKLLQTDFISNNWLAEEKSFYILTNDITKIHLFSYRLTRNIVGRLPRNVIIPMQIALQEVLVNAIEHGNLGLTFEQKTKLKKEGGNYLEKLYAETSKKDFASKKVYVNYLLTDEFVQYIIKDEGKGFDWKKYMVDKKVDEFNVDLFSLYHGMGLLIIKKAFDEIIFNDKGNEVTLIKKLDIK